MLSNNVSRTSLSRGFNLLEVLFVLFVVAAMVALTAPKFIHMKTVARKQVLSSIAVEMEKASRFVRAQSFIDGILDNTDKFFLVCFNHFQNSKCGKSGTTTDIISTDMILVQRGFPFVSSQSVIPVVSLLGYHYKAPTHEELKQKISKDITLFESCGAYCRVADLNDVCDTDFCIQDSTNGALVVLQGTSASDQCYVRYKHNRGLTPEIEIVNSGC